jgi:hypothetical protein
VAQDLDHLQGFVAILIWGQCYSLNTVQYCMTNIACKVVLVFCHADLRLTCHSILPNLFHHAAQLFCLM